MWAGERSAVYTTERTRFAPGLASRPAPGRPQPSSTTLMPSQLLPRPWLATRAAVLRALVVVLAAPLAACGQRAVEVGTGATPAPVATTFEFTNTLAQAVNVYLRGPDGAEVFLRQVGGRSTETVPVRGVTEGAVVQLRIAPVDGAANIVRNNVVVGRGTPVRVP